MKTDLKMSVMTAVTILLLFSQYLTLEILSTYSMHLVKAQAQIIMLSTTLNDIREDMFIDTSDADTKQYIKLMALYREKWDKKYGRVKVFNKHKY